MGTGEVQAFLTHLALEEYISASTQNQALNALLFLYRNVLISKGGEMRYIRFAILYVITAVALFALSNPQKTSASFERQEDYNCVFLSDTLAIPDDGSWLPICLLDPSAQEGSTVTEMNVKILVNHPDPGQLEIRLTRTDADNEVPLSSSEITKEGVGSFT